MASNYIRLHAMSLNLKYPTGIDLFYLNSEQQECWIDTLHIDTCTDLGIDAEARARILAGETLEIKLTASA